MRCVLIMLITLAACNEYSDKDHHTAGNANQKLHSAMAEMEGKMKDYKYTNDPDVDFASLMYIHHAAAVDMANIEVEHGSDKSLVAMANQIIKDQKKEMGVFDSYIHSGSRNDENKAYVAESKSHSPHPHSATDFKSIDTLFAVLMIPHHEQAIEMSNVYLKYSNDSKIKKIAETLIATQSSELEKLKKWVPKR